MRKNKTTLFKSIAIHSSNMCLLNIYWKPPDTGLGAGDIIRNKTYKITDAKRQWFLYFI